MIDVCHLIISEVCKYQSCHFLLLFGYIFFFFLAIYIFQPSLCCQIDLVWINSNHCTMSHPYLLQQTLKLGWMRAKPSDSTGMLLSIIHTQFFCVLYNIIKGMLHVLHSFYLRLWDHLKNVISNLSLSFIYCCCLQIINT